MALQVSSRQLEPLCNLLVLLFDSFPRMNTTLPNSSQPTNQKCMTVLCYTAVMQIEYEDRDLDVSDCAPAGFCPASGQEALEFCES